MKIYLFHTQFNSTYSDLIGENNSFKQSTGRFSEGFGITKSIALVYRNDDNSNFLFNDEVKRPQNVESVILIISDILYTSGGEIQQVIEEILKNFIKEEDEIWFAYHQNENYKSFPDYFKATFEKQIKQIKPASHLKENLDENPFYKLVDIVNSNSVKQYITAFDNLQSIFHSDKEVQQTNDLNQKIALLYKVLDPKFTATKADNLPDELKDKRDLLQPYFDCDVSESNEDEKTARLRHLRDVLLKDII